MNKKQLINYLRKQGFSEQILQAFERIRREDFISKEYKEYAYHDEPLPIGKDQTISQPYTIAFMLSLLEISDNMKILEIGSGSGYVLALINEISKNSKIFGIERIKELAESSMNVLKNNKNIKIIYGNGVNGLKQEAPFNRILVSASAENIPQNLLAQLNYNGILVCVVKTSVIIIKKLYGQNKVMEYPGFVFVPLVD